MNRTQLSYFLAAAENRSFTKAAEQHYISQTAVTLQIRALEEQLGCQLFDRSRRPLELTPAGQIFLQEARAILSRMDSAVAKTREASTGLVGSIRIGYTKGYERSDLSNWLRQYHQRYPNVMMTCHRETTDLLSAGLQRGDYDVVFTWDSTNLKQDPAFAYRVIENSRLVAALYDAHPLAGLHTIQRAQLRGEKILYMSPSGAADSYRDAFYMQLYLNAGYEPDIRMRSTDVESILMMVAAEEGVSILPDYCTRKLQNADNLVFVPLSGADEFAEIIAVWPADSANAALRRLLDSDLLPQPV